MANITIGELNSITEAQKLALSNKIPIFSNNTTKAVTIQQIKDYIFNNTFTEETDLNNIRSSSFILKTENGFEIIRYNDLQDVLFKEEKGESITFNDIYGSGVGIASYNENDELYSSENLNNYFAVGKYYYDENEEVPSDISFDRPDLVNTPFSNSVPSFSMITEELYPGFYRQTIRPVDTHLYFIRNFSSVDIYNELFTYDGTQEIPQEESIYKLQNGEYVQVVELEIGITYYTKEILPDSNSWTDWIPNNVATVGTAKVGESTIG